MPDEIYTIKARKPKTGEEKDYTAKHNENWKSRNGYKADFLGVELKFPSLESIRDSSQLAIVDQPSDNGKYSLDYSNFSVAFNKTLKLPVVTAVNIHGKTNDLAMVHEPRGSDKWFLDGRIKDDENYFQFTDFDYKGSNFQKGHMVRFYDPAWSINADAKAIAIGDTFHYTNACPQVGKFNAGIWNDLEDYYMARAIFQDNKVSVFTGPILQGSKKLNGLLVPVSYWKVIAYKSEGKLNAMAFLITHKVAIESMIEARLLLEDRLVEPTLSEEDIARFFGKLKQWRVKIELIEEKTGIEFGLNKYDVFKGHLDRYFIETLTLGEKPILETFTRTEEFQAYKKEIDEDIELLKSL